MYRTETPTQSTPAEIDLERKLQKLTTQPDEAGEFRIDPAEKQQVVDAVWGVQEEGSPKYNSVGWVRTAVLLMKTQIGLGVLSIPSVFSTVGMIPGIILLLVIGAITGWSAHVIGQFKQRHPHCHSVADVGQMWWGPVGREIFGALYWLYMTFIAGSAFLSVSIALNAISLHATCTQVFVVVGLIVCYCLASIQTLDRVSYIGWIGLVSIVVAVLTLTISVGVEDRPAAAPQNGPWDKDLVLFGNPTFGDAADALGTLIFAYGATPAFFNVIAEMKNPKDFTKAAITAQSLITLVYVTLSIVVYYYCGQYVASPALGSAGLLMKRICYGIAIPGLLVSGLLFTHLPAKYVFVRLLRGSEHLSRNTVTHWVVWLGSVAGCAIFSYIIASAIPFFGNLISLVGALFGTPLVICLESGMWIYYSWDQWKYADRRGKWFYLGLAINSFLILVGVFITVGGTYGSVVAIKASFDAGTNGSPFSCANNAGAIA